MYNTNTSFGTVPFLSPRDKNKVTRRVSWLGSQLSVEEGSIALRGGECPRGTLSKNSLAHTVRSFVRPSVLPKRKCREATTGNGGSDGAAAQVQPKLASALWAS